MSKNIPDPLFAVYSICNITIKSTRAETSNRSVNKLMNRKLISTIYLFINRLKLWSFRFQSRLIWATCGYHGNSNWDLMLQQTPPEQLLCQNYDRRLNRVSVYNATKQTNVVFPKRSVNNWDFSIMLWATVIWFHAAYPVSCFPGKSRTQWKECVSLLESLMCAACNSQLTTRGGCYHWSVNPSDWKLCLE